MKQDYYRIEITSVGWLFLALCVGIGIAALNTGNNLLYLMFGMMLSFIILSGLLSNNTLHRLALVPNFPKRIFAKTMLSVGLEVKNAKEYFPSYAISVFPSSSESQSSEGTFILKIPPNGFENAQARIQFSKRGYHSLPGFRIETSYPFGLLKKYKVQGSEEKSLVYPAILKLPQKVGLENQYLGDLLSDHRGESSNPYGIRDFMYGDHYRYIHWKSSAKQKKLHLKEFEDEKRMSIEVDLRLDGSANSREELREYAVSITASFIHDLIERGIDVFLRINGEMVEARHLDELLAALALCKPAEHEPDYKSLSRETQSIVISDLEKKSLPADTLFTIGKEQIMEYA